jgi:hypothetical protein
MATTQDHKKLQHYNRKILNTTGLITVECKKQAAVSTAAFFSWPIKSVRIRIYRQCEE